MAPTSPTRRRTCEASHRFDRETGAAISWLRVSRQTRSCASPFSTLHHVFGRVRANVFRGSLWEPRLAKRYACRSRRAELDHRGFQTRMFLRSKAQGERGDHLRQCDIASGVGRTGNPRLFKSNIKIRAPDEVRNDGRLQSRSQNCSSEVDQGQLSRRFDGSVRSEQDNETRGLT
jgi:hypothetical protein